jgi:hypothetical protein
MCEDEENTRKDDNDDDDPFNMKPDRPEGSKENVALEKETTVISQEEEEHQSLAAVMQSEGTLKLKISLK